MCPDLVLIPHTSGLYGRVSHRMFDLCETVTPQVERRSIDEGYLDLAPCGFATQVDLEARIRALDAAIVAELLKFAVGGMGALLNDSMAVFAPNANSYRRFRANSYAPVAPTWGINNRTVSFRVPAGPAPTMATHDIRR